MVTVGLALAALGVAQSDNRDSEWFGYLAAGRSFYMLGSEQARLGSEIAFGRVFEEPKLLRKFGPSVRAVESIYGLGTIGQDGRWNNTASVAFGVEYGIRFTNPMSSWFIEPAFGFQDQSHTSRDLPSNLNSTPVINAGRFIRADHRQFIGIRWLHISNGNTTRHNRGQNQMMLTIGSSF